MFERIGHKILSLVAIIVTLGLLGMGGFYASHQESTILAQNQRTMTKLTESVIQSLQTVMLAGYADIAQVFADRLKNVREVEDFRIMRTDGHEAFRDNKTIDDVNRRRGEEEFIPRENETEVAVIANDNDKLAQVLQVRDIISYYEEAPGGGRMLTFLAPIENLEACHKCHGGREPLRGVLKLTTSMEPVEKDIRSTWMQASVVMFATIAGIVLLTGVLIRRSVVEPISTVTGAMARAAEGDLNHKVPVLGRDELSHMAGSFNRMAEELTKTYSGLRNEQDKLSTIILSAREGMVVTDSEGRVVLMNPAAEMLLGKSMQQVRDEGFMNLVGDPHQVMRWLERTQDQVGEPEIVRYNERTLSVYAATIIAEDGQMVGSAALFRDITEEKRLEGELIKLSITDGLTGLFNRRHLDQTLDYEFARARRYSLPLSVFMCDVDHFKKFNDQHGHDQGDRVLQAVAAELKRGLRQIDYACRYGGEEFTGILPNTSPEGAATVAERFRAAVEDLVIDGLRVTISIGVAGVPEHAVENPEALVELADQALYQAKEGGRNRVQLARLPARAAG